MMAARSSSKSPICSAFDPRRHPFSGKAFFLLSATSGGEAFCATVSISEASLERSRLESAMNYHLAQINIGRLIAPLDDPRIAEFVAQLAPINALADDAPGFVWRLQSSSGNATDIAYNDDPFVIVNMSVWESIEALRHYAYKSDHAKVFRDRAKWFEKMEKPNPASRNPPARKAPPAVETTFLAEASVPKPAPAAITITTTTVIAPAVVAMPIAIVAPSVIAPAIEATTVVSMEPWASPNEDSVYEPIWAVIAVRRASIWVIIIVAVAADRCRTNIPVRWPNSNADKDSLCVGERCRT